MPTLSRRTPPITTACCIRSLLLVSTLSGLALSPLAVAAQPVANAEAQTRLYTIPAQPLDTAILAWSLNSGVQLFADANMTRGVTSRAVQGQYTPWAALQQMLTGTGLSFSRGDDNRAYLQRAAETGTLELGATSIQGQRLGEVTEGTGSYASGGASTATKLPLSIRETPQSVTVITRQRMDDQRLDTVDDVLANTPGITLRKRTGGGNDILARGFDTNTLQYDGVPLPRSYSNGNMLSSSSVYLDRVEVLRGAQGLLEGSGSPAGSVNLVRKRGLAAPAMTLEARAGSWDNYGTRLDTGAPLNEAKSLRGRAVVDYEDKNGFIDKVWDRNINGYSAVDFDVTPDTTIGLGLAYSRLKGNSGLYYGVPRYANGTSLSLPRKTNLEADWAQATREETQVFFDLEHQFNQHWRLKVAGVHIDEAYDAQTAFSYFNFVPVGGRTMTAPGLTYDFGGKSKGADINLSGDFDAFGIAQQVVVGANYANQTRNDSFDEYASTIADTLNPNMSIQSLGSRTLNRTRNTRAEITQKGLYALWRGHLTERTTLLLGSRVSWAALQSETKNPLTGATTTRSQEAENGEVTPYAGVVYELTPQWSAYASYTEIFEPQNALDAELKILQPMTGSNYETGIKGELFAGALNTSLAFYRTEQQGRAVTDYDSPRVCSGAYCSRAAGEVRSEGIEVEAHGHLTEQLQISAGYTYNHNEYLDDANASLVGKPFSYETPRHSIRLWSSYRLDGALSDWRVGLGVNYRSEQRTGSATLPDPVQGGYSVWSGMIAYEPNSNWSASVNIENIFDKHYYSAISQNYLNNYAGEPRNLLLSVRYKL